MHLCRLLLFIVRVVVIVFAENFSKPSTSRRVAVINIIVVLRWSLLLLPEVTGCHGRGSICNEWHFVRVLWRWRSTIDVVALRRVANNF